MLYALHEFQKTITAPLVAWMDASHRLFSSPYSPLAYTPVSRHVAASSELLKRLMRSYHKPSWGIHHVQIGERSVPVTIEDMIHHGKAVVLMLAGKEKIAAEHAAAVRAGFESLRVKK